MKRNEMKLAIFFNLSSMLTVVAIILKIHPKAALPNSCLNLSEFNFCCLLRFIIIPSSGGSWYFSLGEQGFKKLGVVENTVGSHTQKVTLDNFTSR